MDIAPPAQAAHTRVQARLRKAAAHAQKKLLQELTRPQ